jgi:hypothetical protein
MPAFMGHAFALPVPAAGQRSWQARRFAYGMPDASLMARRFEGRRRSFHRPDFSRFAHSVSSRGFSWGFAMASTGKELPLAGTVTNSHIEGETFMRSILLATCLVLGSAGAAFVTPARAEVDIRVPGVHIDTGRDHHEDWRRHERFEHERHCEHGWDCRR